MAVVDGEAAEVKWRVLAYQYNPVSMRHEARCGKCRRLAAWITDEAMHRYPDAAVLGPVSHLCPCTCDDDPYNCPVGQSLAIAIIDRKGNQ